MISGDLLLVGTSSWRHRDWRQSFYPPTTEEHDQLAFYSSRFDCVEIAESFYRLPERHTLVQWVEETPDDFRMPLLAPRIITHDKKLKNCENQIDTLFTRLRGLERKLRPVVFQLPLKWHCNLRRLEAFMVRLSDNFRYVFEFLDGSWLTPPVCQLLNNNQFGHCVRSSEDISALQTIPTNMIYLRLGSPNHSPSGIYHPRLLRGWAMRIREWTRKGKTVYVVFHGATQNAVLKNAQRIRRYIREVDKPTASRDIEEVRTPGF